ncbi:caudovirus prohead protease [Acutalibacter sp. 1XD8-33]|nr:caudovirus prohead protease [Acutalibacter sp. 1XD8-33]
MTRAAETENNFHRDMTVSAIRAEEGEGRKVTLSFSSEEPYDRIFGPEILDHSEGAVDLSRLNSIGCVLYNHNRDKVIGKITRAWVENGRGQAEVEFDDDAESDTIYRKVKSGSLKGVSVGYMVNMREAEDVRAGKKSKDGRFSGPCRVMKKWQPYEISIVSIPADSTVGVGREWDGPEFSPLGETPQLARRATLTAGAPLSVYERQLQINKNIIGGM